MTSRFQVMYGGVSLNVLSVTMDAAIDQYAWRGTVELTDEAQYRMIAVKGSVVVSVFGEAFHFIVDQKSYSAQGIDKPSMSIGIISRAELYSTMQVDRLTGSLPEYPSGVDMDAMSGKGVPSYQLGQIGIPVVWHVPGYTVPYASIKADNESGIGLLTTLAETAGAKVRSDKNGGVHVYQVLAPTAGVVVHTFDGIRDVLSVEVTEAATSSPQVKAVRFTTSATPPETSVQAELATDMNSSTFYPGDKVYLYVYSDGADVDGATYGLYGGGDLDYEGTASRPYTYDIREELDRTLTPCEDSMVYITGDPVREGSRRWQVWSLTLPTEEVLTPYEIRVEFSADMPSAKRCITRTVGGSGVVVDIADDVVFGNDTLMQRRVSAIRSETALAAASEAVVTVPFRHGLDINQRVAVTLEDRSFTGVTQALRYTVDREKALCQVTIRGRWA